MTLHHQNVIMYLKVTIFKWRSRPHFVFQWRSRPQVNLVWRSRPYVNLVWRSRPQIQGKLFIFDVLFSKSCGCHSFSVIFTKPRPPIFEVKKSGMLFLALSKILTFKRSNLASERGTLWPDTLYNIARVS